LEAAAFSNDPDLRNAHRGVALWIRSWLAGSTMERYAAQARSRLAVGEDGPVERDGSPWMESDGGEP
jgi:hypothetical protein